MRLKSYTLIIAIILGLSSCNEETANNPTNSKLPQLERLSSNKTNVHFINSIKENIDNTMLNNNNIYAGGGVAIGDINNDGLQDFVVISNQDKPGLFLNTGNFEFEDITDSAGLSKSIGWNTGVVMEDVNADGFIDIYISKGIYTDKEPSIRMNLLYINNHDNTFTEEAEKYGIADNNATIQSVFFDFDLDGDLDLYSLNQPLGDQNMRLDLLAQKRINNSDQSNSDRFYLNLGNNKFKDVSSEVGIHNWANGLGIGIADFNKDGYPDIYITNDFDTDNFLYFNNKGKKFIESAKTSFKHISYFAMGLDIADINNDGELDIFEVEMLPKERKRSIMNMASMNPKLFKELSMLGFVPQYMRNSLHLNRGRGHFSEIAQIANVAKTDWSWGTLLVDIDDDGLKDIFITNGIVNDLKDRDSASKGNKIAEQNNGQLSFDEFQNMYTSTPVPNYAFKNKNGIEFEDVSKKWNFGKKGFSNGLSYADFDNDGDLDLVVNNLNEEPWIYKNNSAEKGKNNINFKLKGSPKNQNGIGAKVHIYMGDKIQYAEQYVVRGFISSSQPLIHFGLDQYNKVDSVKIVWPDLKSETIKTALDANNTYTLDYKNAIEKNPQKKIFKRYFKGASRALNITNYHEEVEYDDYAKELLLPHKLSQLGPALTKGDINNDGQDDIFIGGSAGFPAKLYLSNGTNYDLNINPLWEQEKKYEDISATIFDADQDGDNDLYVVSGSNQFEPHSTLYSDRLYLNDGKGNYLKSQDKLPETLESGGVVIEADLDGDKDLDLFVGGRLVPGKYPTTPNSQILINENGVFSDKTSKEYPEVKKLGMVTDALWSDYDNDGDKDLFAVGEWMGIRLFNNSNGKLNEVSNETGLEDTEGWWFSITEIDFDKDGDKDYLVGNIGLNHKFKTSPEKPFQVFSDDFDDNGTNDIVLAFYQEDNFFPVRGRDCSSEQMPFIKEKFPTFASFGDAKMKDIYGEKLNSAFSLKANTFASMILVNNNGSFEKKELPNLAQISAITGCIEYDINEDGHEDLIVAGNMYNTEPETSSADASFGLLLLGDGKGNYTHLDIIDSGVFLPGDVKNLEMIDVYGRKALLVANNNSKFQTFLYHPILKNSN